MKGRIIDITGTPRHIALHRGFLLVQEGEAELGRLDLDGIAAILISSHGATVSTGAIAACATRLIPIIISDSRHQPIAITTPLSHHFDQQRRYLRQARLKSGKTNQLWQAIVKAKIRNQARLLQEIGSDKVARLDRLRSTVRAGDPTNAEAHAAQIYWPALFGDAFRRDKKADGLNAMLNYGYAVLRALTVKALLATGLHPSFGLHHHNRQNPFCLADDVMEPFRPLIDQLVFTMAAHDITTLDRRGKTILASLVMADVASLGTLSPLGQSVVRLCQALHDQMAGVTTPLPFPDVLTDIELQGLIRTC